MGRSEGSFLPSTLLQFVHNRLGRASVVSVLTRFISGSQAHHTRCFGVLHRFWDQVGRICRARACNVVLHPCLYYVNFICIMTYYLYIIYVYSTFDPSRKILAAPAGVGV